MSVFAPYLIALVVALIFTHAVKYLIALIRGRAEDFWHQLFASGGMPSSHAAATLSVWTVIALRDGIDSGLFGLATLLALIVCYDAVKVRRSTGEQGEAIRQLIAETKSDAKIPRAAKGHTPLEVAVGILFGIVIGYVVYMATR
jgi:uncharacterized protein